MDLNYSWSRNPLPSESITDPRKWMWFVCLSICIPVPSFAESTLICSCLILENETCLLTHMFFLFFFFFVFSFLFSCMASLCVSSSCLPTFCHVSTTSLYISFFCYFTVFILLLLLRYGVGRAEGGRASKEAIFWRTETWVGFEVKRCLPSRRRLKTVENHISCYIVDHIPLLTSGSLSKHPTVSQKWKFSICSFMYSTTSRLQS